MVVEALMIVDTMEFVYANVGYVSFNLSVAIRVKALLSITTVASEFNVNLLAVSKQLYG